MTRTLSIEMRSDVDIIATSDDGAEKIPSKFWLLPVCVRRISSNPCSVEIG
jgi:hypothetical protein